MYSCIVCPAAAPPPSVFSWMENIKPPVVLFGLKRPQNESNVKYVMVQRARRPIRERRPLSVTQTRGEEWTLHLQCFLRGRYLCFHSGAGVQICGLWSSRETTKTLGVTSDSWVKKSQRVFLVPSPVSDTFVWSEGRDPTRTRTRDSRIRLRSVHVRTLRSDSDVRRVGRGGGFCSCSIDLPWKSELRQLLSNVLPSERSMKKHFHKVDY